MPDPRSLDLWTSWRRGTRLHVVKARDLTWTQRTCVKVSERRSRFAGASRFETTNRPTSQHLADATWTCSRRRRSAVDACRRTMRNFERMRVRAARASESSVRCSCSWHHLECRLWSSPRDAVLGSTTLECGRAIASLLDACCCCCHVSEPPLDSCAERAPCVSGQS